MCVVNYVQSGDYMITVIENYHKYSGNINAWFIIQSFGSNIMNCTENCDLISLYC